VSYQHKQPYGWIVACDVCHEISAIGNRDWREMRRDAQNHPIHLCPHCRKTAVWIEKHQRYYQPEDNLRASCVVCGGLFTARVHQHIQHCPGCRRGLIAAGGLPEPVSAPPHPHDIAHGFSRLVQIARHLLLLDRHHPA
jgi:uncharacterized protein YlaI